MSEYFFAIGASAAFDAAGATKRDLCRGEQLFAGLNCFEPGQSQRVHTHTGADKFYVVVSGKARMVVGEETRVAEALERTVMLVAIAPPPSGGGERPMPSVD